MKKARSDTASREYTFIVVLGIIILAFLVLISSVGAMKFATVLVQ